MANIVEVATGNRRVVVRGGRVIDGSGMPAFTADVEIVDGRIRQVGRVDPIGAEVIDADGLIVAPGFVDIHTHYDAQLHFEPTACPSPVARGVLFWPGSMAGWE